MSKLKIKRRSTTRKRRRRRQAAKKQAKKEAKKKQSPQISDSKGGLSEIGEEEEDGQ